MIFELSNPGKRMGDALGGQLFEACYYVQRGKPAAILAVQQRYIERACELVMRDGLYAHIEESTKGWVNLWIFKYPHIKNVFESLHQITDETAKHWILGKMCGFDEPSIHEYISKQDEGGKKNDGFFRSNVSAFDWRYYFLLDHVESNAVACKKRRGG